MSQEQEVPKKSKAKWIILIVLLLLLGGGGAGAWFFFLKDKMSGHTGTDAAAPPKEVQQAPPVGTGTITALPVFRVNLKDPLGKRFIKLMVEVETSTPETATELVTLQAPIRDSIILLLSSKSYTDIESPESKVLLKNEITDRINQILGGPKVKQVFFTDIIIQ